MRITQIIWCGKEKIFCVDDKEIKELKRLRTLDLSFSKITDVGLKELKELKSMEDLNISETQVTDVGLKELEKFWLSGTSLAQPSVHPR